MTDEAAVPAIDKTKSLVTDDLRVIVDGSSKRLFIKDKDGVEHNLPPLTIRDLIDFEDTIGHSVLDVMNASINLKHVVYLLYCSLRKEGIASAEIKKRKYKYTEDDVSEMFDLAMLRNAVPLFTGLLSISGFGRSANPPAPSQSPVTTPENEPAKA